jgi:uncharacterized protein YjbI with pentapeptide repeats
VYALSVLFCSFLPEPSDGYSMTIEPPDFSGQALARASFVDQDLSGAKFVGTDLTEADFSGALLNRADLSFANLTGAKLDRAKLQDACLDNANLTRASFGHATLDRSGIENAHMPGANLTGATGKGIQKKLEGRLQSANTQAERLRNVFIASFAFFGYIGSTSFMMNDALVLTNLSTMELPVVDAKVSVHGFFLLSAVLGVAISSYLLALTAHFARVVARLPARLPEGPPVREQIDPWVLSCMGILRRPELPLLGQPQLGSMALGIFEMIGERIPRLAARWIAPLVLGVQSYRFFVACRFDRSALLNDLTFLALVVLFLCSWSISFGLVVYAELVEGTRPRANPRHHAALALACVGGAIVVRIALGQLLPHGVPDEALQGARLPGSTLRNWNLAGANLTDANLSNSDLSNAHLQETDLSGADLRHASLGHASFCEADLSKAQLALSTGEFANFTRALREPACSAPA